VTTRRVATAALGWLVVCGVALVAGLHPSPPALAAVTIAAASATWRLLDLSALVRTPAWGAHVRPVVAGRRGDARLTRLHRTLLATRESPAAVAELRTVLLAVLDERLRDSHVGGGRPDDDAADLRRSLTHDALPTSPAALGALLDRIESL
jgi:hypothetical protein